MLPPPGTDAAPGAVPVRPRTRWRAALSRWWAFARGVYAGRVAAAAARASNHRFFPHASEPAKDERPPHAPPRGVTVRKA